MSSPRFKAIAFISEYIIYREDDWNSSTHKVTSYLTSYVVSMPDPEERKKACDDIKNKIEAADDPEKLVRIIYEIAQLARNVQAAQETTKDSYLKWLFSDNSLFAKALHAARTLLVNSLKKYYSNDYENEIIKLRSELEKKEKLLDINLSGKVNISHLKNERNLIYNRLLDMQDLTTIHHACKYDNFPPSLPPHDTKKLKIPAMLKINQNIPIVYDNDYYNIYYVTEVCSESKRENCFVNEMRVFVAPNTNSKSVDIMDENYFPPDVFDKNQPLSQYNPHALNLFTSNPKIPEKSNEHFQEEFQEEYFEEESEEKLGFKH